MAIETLTRALSNGLVHHAYRFEGGDGVGKEMAAIALAQALLCDDHKTGCGECQTCRRVAKRADQPPQVPLHPDVVMVGRQLYPESIIGKKEIKEISVQQIRRVVLSRVAYAPHEGRAQVFIIRAADQLSIGAANALLKTLEEPRPDAHFVLLTSRPDKLLDTIRSRSLPVRFGPLPDEVIASILRDNGVDQASVADAVEMAGGSAAVALAVADAEESQARGGFVRDVMKAVEASDMHDAITLAESLKAERSELIGHLRALASTYARCVRRDVGAAPRRAELAARRYELVLDAVDAIERNGAAGLAVASLVASLKHAHQRRPGTKPPIVLQRR